MALKSKLLLCLMVFFYSPLTAQNDTLAFRQLTIQDGLSQGIFRDILQDSNGFIWFATFSGLNRYDGNEVVVYDADGKPGSLGNQEVYSLYEDRQQQLWVGTHNHLYTFDENAQIFKKIPTAWQSDDNLIIYDIMEDRSGILWVATNQGIASLNKSLQVLVKSHLFTSRSDVAKSLLCYSLTECKNGDIWFATNQGILHLDKDTERAEMHLKNIKAHRISESVNGVLVAATSNGIYQWNAQQGFFERRFSLETLDIENSSIRDLSWGPDGRLWLATNKGIVILDAHFKVAGHVQTQAGNANGLLSNVVQRLYFDRENRLWVGSMGGVAIERDLNKPFYTNNLSITNATAPEVPTPVWTVFETREGNSVFVGSISNGLFQLSAENPGKVLAHYGKNELPFLTIYDILQFDEDHLLISGDKGLALFDLNTFKASEIYLDIPEDTGKAVYHMAEYSEGSYFLEPESGVFYYSYSDKKLLNLNEFLQFPFSSREVITLDYLKSGKLWVGTKAGLKIIDIPSNFSSAEITRLKAKEVLLDSVHSGPNIVTAIRANEGESVWVGTTEGLYKFTQAGEMIRYFGASQGLASEFINSMEVDARNNLWISTNKGLSVLFYQNEEIVNFDYSDGLTNLEFNNESSCFSQSGRMFFGGISGLNYFYPDSIQVSFNSPNVSITSMWLYDQKVVPHETYNGEVVLDKPIRDVDTLTLNHKNSFVSFRFTSFAFVNPDRAYYAYRMKGMESNWNIRQGITTASYLNLPPGEYVFQVRAANHDHVWSDVADEITIIINPPFWQKTWVIALASFLFFALVFLYVRFRNWKLQKRKRELEREVESRTYEILEAQEELEQSTIFNESIVTNAREGITVVSPKGDIRFVNRAACKMLLYTEEELLSKNTIDLTLNEYLERDRMMMEEILKNGSASYEKKLMRKDGVIIDVEINASNNVGIEDSVISIFSDITERKNNLRELKRYRNQLEMLVEERTKELFIQKEKAERADRLKSAFLANMSHEVRTPLNAIVGFSSLLKHQQADRPETQEYVSYIEQNSQSLLQLIQDIIDLSKLESGEVEVTKHHFNLNMLIQQALKKLEAKRQAEGKEISIIPFNHSEPINGYSDERRIRQLLEALLDNALKYTDQGTVSVEVVPISRNNHIQVSVKDTGIGIPPNCKEDVFERFVKLESPEKRIFRGTGLGLSIVKQISQLLDLDITVDSTPGKGSVFSFVLPLAQEENAEKQPHENITALTPNLTGRTVLIAEDDEANFLLLNEYMKRTEAQVVWARNGVEALQKVKSVEPDLIFMDLKMPEKDGLETTRMLRASGVNIPIVALTAYTQEHDRVEALKAGCNDYLRKPASLKEVYDVLRKYLINHH
jgi:PAS domain S-box-containing protein